MVCVVIHIVNQISFFLAAFSFADIPAFVSPFAAPASDMFPELWT